MSEELVVVEEPRGAMLEVAPQVTAAELVKRLHVIEDAMRTAMKQDVDYGVIPGTGTKPTLLKPGAEKLGALFQLDVQLANEKTWHDDGHLTVVSRATVYHQPTGTRLGSGEGICTTREAKYAYRKADRVCPVCGKPAIVKGRAEYGGGWVCFKKKDGCGAKFPDGDRSIEAQETGRVPNPDIADAFNTVDKMASKRARIDAVLAVTGASALFTQDIEDFQPDEPVAAAEPEPKPEPASIEELTEFVKLAEACAAVDKAFQLEHNLKWARTAPPAELKDASAQLRKYLEEALGNAEAQGTLDTAEVA